MEPYPTPIHHYLAQSFDYPEYLLRATTTMEMPLFRVIPATAFLDYFESDRSHMYNVNTGQWLAPPPNYQCITRSTKDNKSASKRRTNLQIYLNFDDHHPESSQEDVGIPTTAVGKIMTLDELKDYNWQSY
jgi:hypothetical protein